MMFQPVKTYSRKKSKRVLSKENPNVDDVFSTASERDLSPFALSDSSENDKENQLLNSPRNRKGGMKYGNRRAPKRLKSEEKMKNYNRYLTRQQFTVKSSPKVRKKSSTQSTVNHQMKTKQPTPDRGSGRIQNKQGDLHEVKQDSPPSIELPRKDVQVSWQEKISMLYPLMVDKNARVSHYHKETQRGLPALNLSYEHIEEEEEEEESFEDGEEEDVNEEENVAEKSGSTEYTTTYTYTWVTDNGTQTQTRSSAAQKTSMQSVNISPIPNVEDINIDDIKFPDEGKVKEDHKEQIHPTCKNNDAVTVLEDTMGFKRNRKSEILNSTVKNVAAHNIKQVLFPSDISCINSNDPGKFRASLNKPDYTENLVCETAELSESRKDSNKGKISNSTLSVLQTKKTQKQNEVIKDRSKKGFEILNSTEKQSAKCLQQIEWPEELSAIKSYDSDKTKTQITSEGTPKKTVQQSVVSIKTQKENDVMEVRSKKSFEVLNSTEKQNAKCLQQMKWPEEFSAIKPHDSDKTKTQIASEKTPNKVVQLPDVSTPKKAKKSDDSVKKKKRKLLPKNSTLLFISDRVELVDFVPEMSTIRSVNKSNNQTSSADKNSNNTQKTTHRVSSPFMFHVEPPQENYQNMFGNVLTSTPAKLFSKTQANGLEFDISSVPQPSCDEDELVVQTSRVVNSCEIVSIHSDVGLDDKQNQINANVVCTSMKEDAPTCHKNDNNSTIVPEKTCKDNNKKITPASSSNQYDNLVAITSDVDNSIGQYESADVGSNFPECNGGAEKSSVSRSFDQHQEKSLDKVSNTANSASKNLIHKVSNILQLPPKNVKQKNNKNSNAISKENRYPHKVIKAKMQPKQNIVQLCPLTNLGKPWPKRKAVINMKTGKMRPLNPAQYQTDVLLSLGRCKLRKIQHMQMNQTV